MKLLSAEFWNYALERCLKTIAQAALAYLGSGSIGVFEIDWIGLLSISLGAGLLSVLTSIISQKD